jgi:FHA domain
MEILCPGCATSNLSNARFCDQCAYELPKPSASLASDLPAPGLGGAAVSVVDPMATIVPDPIVRPNPPLGSIPTPRAPNVSGSAAPGMGSISRPQSPLPPAAFVRPAVSTPVSAPLLADANPWANPSPSAGHTYIPETPPAIPSAILAPGMIPPAALAPALPDQDNEAKPLTVRATSSPKTVMLGTPGNPLLIPTLGIPSARLYGRRHGVLDETPIPINAPLSIGRFDPSSGPVDVDLSTYPSGESVSRLHARIEQTPSCWMVRDADSANGVYVKPANATVFGPRLVGPHRLVDGDEIAFGNVMMVFRQD